MLKKNDGHALIVVLLIITISIVFMTILFGLSTFTSKQTTNSQTDMQTTDAAEMGITFFQKKIDQIINGKDYKTIDEFVKKLNDNLTLKKANITNNLSYTVQLTAPIIKQNKDNVTIIPINFKSEGLQEKKTKTIIKNIEIKILSNGSTGGNNQGGIFENKVQFDSIRDSSRLDLTKPNSQAPFKDTEPNVNNINGTCQYPDNSRIINNGNNQGFDNHCKHYISGNALLTGYTPIASDANVEIGRNAQFNQQTDFAKKSNVTIKGNALFNGSISLAESSKLSIGGDGYFQGDVPMKEQSYISIDGNATFTSMNMNKAILLVKKNLLDTNNIIMKSSLITVEGSARLSTINISEDSKLEVYGNLYSDNWLTVSGTVCVHGSADIQIDAGKIKNVTSCENKPPGYVYVLNQPIINDSIGDINIGFGDSDVTYQ